MSKALSTVVSLVLSRVPPCRYSARIQRQRLETPSAGTGQLVCPDAPETLRLEPQPAELLYSHIDGVSAPSFWVCLFFLGFAIRIVQRLVISTTSSCEFATVLPSVCGKAFPVNMMKMRRRCLCNSRENDENDASISAGSMPKAGASRAAWTAATLASRA